MDNLLQHDHDSRGNMEDFANRYKISARKSNGKVVELSKHVNRRSQSRAVSSANTSRESTATSDNLER